MGLSVTKVASYKVRAQFPSGGLVLKTFLDVTFDSSYLTGGEVLDLSAYGGDKILGVAVVEDATGYVIAYVAAASWAKATGKLKVWYCDLSESTDAKLIDVASEVDLSAVTVRVEITALVRT